MLPGKTWFQSTVGFWACICCPGKQMMPIPFEIVTKWQSDWKYGMPKWTCLQGLIFNNRKWKSREAGWRWKICIKPRFLRVSEQCVSPEDLNKWGATLQKLLSWVYWLRVQHSACQLHLPAFIYCLHCGNPQTFIYFLAIATLEAEWLWRKGAQRCTQWESSVCPKW